MYDMDLAQFQKEIAYIYTLHRCQIHNSKSFPAKTWGHFWTGMWVYQQCMQLEQHSLNIDFKHIHTTNLLLILTHYIFTISEHREEEVSKNSVNIQGQ